MLTISDINQQNLLIISGPSASGKSSAVKNILLDHPEAKEEVSCTTRPMRSWETDGIEYHFIERQEFTRILSEGGFLEHTEYSGNLYGTLSEELAKKTAHDNACISIVDVPGAVKLKEIFPDAYAAFLFAPQNVLEKRIRGRGDDEGAIWRRMQTAQTECGLALMSGVYDAFIKSSTIELDAGTIWHCFKTRKHKLIY